MIIKEDSPLRNLTPTVGSCYGNGLDRLKESFLELLVMLIIVFVIGIPSSIISYSSGLTYSIWNLFSFVYNVFISGPVGYGVAFAYLKAARGERPEIGDIVLIKSPIEPEKVLLKRIIAKEGDTIEIRNKIFYRNDKKIKFTWKTTSTDKRIFPMKFTGRDNSASFRMKRKQYFLVGDNLDYSFDSRNFGPIDEEDIIGRFFLKI